MSRSVRNPRNIARASCPCPVTAKTCPDAFDRDGRATRRGGMPRHAIVRCYRRVIPCSYSSKLSSIPSGPRRRARSWRASAAIPGEMTFCGRGFVAQTHAILAFVCGSSIMGARWRLPRLLRGVVSKVFVTCRGRACGVHASKLARAAVTQPLLAVSQEAQAVPGLQKDAPPGVPVSPKRVDSLLGGPRGDTGERGAHPLEA